MVITTEHATLLQRLREAGEQGLSLAPEDAPLALELEVQALVRVDPAGRATLTLQGETLAQALAQAVREHGLPSPEKWDAGWRWLGTEIIAMLDAARRAGVVGPWAREALQARGLAAPARDRERGREAVQLTGPGETLFDLYQRLHPRLLITAELAEVIRETPLGPTTADELPTGSHEEHLLEGMRLIAYSLPASDVYAYTALGQAVKRALAAGGFAPEGEVLNEDLLYRLAEVADGEPVSPGALETLQALGYVGADGELLPAGEWALEALRLWLDGPRAEVWSFAVEQEEVEVLRAIAHLWEKAEANPHEAPTFENLRREMIDRKVRDYKDLLERYGRRLEEMPKKVQEIARRFAEAKDLARWYDDNFELREALYSLEAFDLIQTADDGDGREVFQLTEHGRAVLEDQGEAPRDISSTAVKAITMTRKRFSAPNLAWWEEARQAGLVDREPTRSGWLYASLAERVRRKPFLSAHEMEVFHHLPARGMDVDRLREELADHFPEEHLIWALEKLEARRLIDLLPDGNIVETEAGEAMDRALAGLEGVGYPVNPIYYRVLRALASVGTLYAKEKRVRILPRRMEQALERSGLPRETFENALEGMRAVGLVGRNSIHEAGLELLAAVEAMNPRQDLEGYAEAETLAADAAQAPGD